MMPTPSNHHQSVMLNESIEGLNIKPDGVYIDATLGRGGHTLGILNQLNTHGQVIAFDQDLSAIEYAQENFQDARLTLVHHAFADMLSVINQHHLVGKIDGILMDLGVSSPQLDNAQRGFSFNTDGPLDMRMDQTRGISAAQWLEQANAIDIANVIYQYGEEKRSRHIAHAIKQYQQDNALTTTLQLANIVASVVKTKKNKHPATRTFQAIRIFINQELQQLSEALGQTLALLAPAGRLCVISFHSIEDRMIKRFIHKHSKPKQLPKGLPIMHSGIEPMLFKNLGKQFSSRAEINRNRRSRSALLRIAERTTLAQKIS